MLFRSVWREVGKKGEECSPGRGKSLLSDLGNELLRWLSGKEAAWQGRRHRRWWFDPWVRKIPWRRKWQPSPVFLPGELRGQRNLVGYSPQNHKQSDTTEVTWHACMWRSLRRPAMAEANYLAQGHPSSKLQSWN